jgi:hypothetical protein
MRKIPDKEETDKDTEKRDNRNTGEPHGCDKLTVSHKSPTTRRLGYCSSKGYHTRLFLEQSAVAWNRQRTFFLSSVFPIKSKISSMAWVMGIFKAQAMFLRVREDFMLSCGF